VGLADGDLGCRVDGFPCHARPNFKRAPIDTLNDSGWFSQERAVTAVLRPVTDALHSAYFSTQWRELNVDCVEVPPVYSFLKSKPRLGAFIRWNAFQRSRAARPRAPLRMSIGPTASTRSTMLLCCPTGSPEFPAIPPAGSYPALRAMHLSPRPSGCLFPSPERLPIAIPSNA